MNLTVVIPAYKVPHKIKEVISTIPDFGSHIIVINYACPDGAGRIAEEMNNPKVTVMYHSVPYQ